MSLSTHRTSTANPRRTQLDVLPAQPGAGDDTAADMHEGPTANPRRTTLVDAAQHEV